VSFFVTSMVLTAFNERTQYTDRPSSNGESKLMPHDLSSKIRRLLTLDQTLRHDRSLLESIIVLLHSLAAASIAYNVFRAVCKHGLGRLELLFVGVRSERRALGSQTMLVDGSFVLHWVESRRLRYGAVSIRSGRHY
jgi:hypothetical protein